MKRWYSVVAINWLNATILFIVANIALGVAYYVVDARRQREQDSIHNPAAVPSLSPDEARAVFQRFRTISHRSLDEPWVGWAEAPYHSRNVNVDAGDPMPTRRTSNSRPSTRTVWLFGGSTAFGFGVTDDQTIASNLQRLLGPDYQIINHGHLGFYSSQELALFHWLLRAGKRANVVVFLDGFNESRQPLDTPGNMEPSADEERMITISKSFPAARLARFFTKRLPQKAAPARQANDPAPMMALRYARNIDLARRLATSYDATPLFVWQPTPYDYFDLEHDPDFQTRRAIYPPDPIMKPLNAQVRQTVTAADFLFLADLFQKRVYRNTFVDSCHYGEEASEILAKSIASAIRAREGQSSRMQGRSTQ
jgi:hypothetical protein